MASRIYTDAFTIYNNEPLAMPRIAFSVVSLMFLTACFDGDQAGAPTVVGSGDFVADTVYINGRIYTVNEAQPWVEAVARRN
jgi:hypothetical protein